MREIILEELSRMKSLFSYERGKVISEQKYITEAFDFITKYPCINPQWLVTKAATGTNIQGPTETGVEFVQGQGDDSIVYPLGNQTFYLKDIQFSETGKWYQGGYERGNFSCSQGKIMLDGKPLTPAKTNATAKAGQTGQAAQKSQASQNTIHHIVTTTEDECRPGQKYDWKTVRHQYQVEKNPSTPEGSLQTNLQLTKDWNAGWRPKCLDKKVSDIQPIQTIQPKSATQSGTTAQSGQTQQPNLQTIRTPNLPNLQQLQAKAAESQTPEQIYKILYDGGMVQGDPEGGGRIRIDPKALKTGVADNIFKDRVEKLKQYMPTLGYEYYRTRNRDGKLVFTKKQQGEE